MKINLNKLTFIIIFLSIVFFIYLITIHLSSIYTGMKFVELENQELKVVEVEKNSIAEREGVQVGDIITKINGKNPRGLTSFNDENVYSFDLKRGDSEYNVSIGYGFISYEGLFLIVMPFLFYFLCLFCIYFIYKSNRKLKLPSAFILILFLIVTSASYMGANGSARGDLFSRNLTLWSFLTVPVLYLHFIYQYFKETGKKFFNKKILYFLYPIGLIVIIFDNVRDRFDITYQLSKNIFLTSFIFVLLISFCAIGYGLLKFKYSEQAFLLRIMILTNFISFSPFVLFYAIPYVFFNDYIFSAMFVVPFLLLIPFSLVYQFVATKIYNIDFLLGRFKYYGLLSILPTIFLVGIFTFLNGNDYPGEISTFPTIKFIVFTYLFMLAVFYLKEILDFRFRLKRFSEKFNYQDSIYKFTQLIRSATSLDLVLAELKTTILDVLLVSKALVLEVKNDGSIQILSEQEEKKREWETYRAEIMKVTEGIGKIVEIDKGFVLKIGERGEQSYVILCLSVLNTPKLTRDEISWLETLSFYTSISLENFIKIEELMNHLEEVKKEGSNPAWLKNLMFAIEEKQRSNLARDLHDSVLQDLISLKRQCEILLDGDKGDHVKNQLQNIDEKMTAVIQTTRETLQELRPQLLYDLGLVKALKKLVSQYKESTSIDIRLNSEKFNTSMDLDSQLNIYRIIQELLTNTAKHSQATRALIMLVCIKDKIVLHYEDNGVGYDREQLNTQEQGSMGLSGIQERVRALNGDLKIDTGIGKGFKAVMNLYL